MMRGWAVEQDRRTSAPRPPRSSRASIGAKPPTPALLTTQSSPPKRSAISGTTRAIAAGVGDVQRPGLAPRRPRRGCAAATASTSSSAHVGHRHFRALAGEHVRGRPAHAAGRAGDQHDLTADRPGKVGDRVHRFLLLKGERKCRPPPRGQKKSIDAIDAVRALRFKAMQQPTQRNSARLRRLPAKQ